MKFKKPSKTFKSHKLPKLGKASGNSLRNSVGNSVGHVVKHKILRRKKPVGILETLTDLPRITNETVAEHREEVLSSARKYIYPLQHSRSRIVKVSVTLFVVAVVAFFVYCGLALYKFQSTSTFIYEVTRVIPFPIARAGGSHFVSYESYLFELRHLTHYYQTQQKENFNDPKTAGHLTQLKRDSLAKVIDDAYTKQLASKNNISVSNREVADAVALVKSQNRLGSTDQMLGDVLKQFWGWSIKDFERELKSQMLAQKVASELDTAAHARAANAYAELTAGKDFAAVAGQYSDDELTKQKGGMYPAALAKSNRDVSPQVIAALFKLQPGQTSEVIDTGYSLEIVKVTEVTGDKVQGAHISVKLQDIMAYIDPLKQKQKPQRFIKV